VGLWTCAFLLGFKEVWSHHFCFLLPFVTLITYRCWNGTAGEAAGYPRHLVTGALALVCFVLAPTPFHSGTASRWEEWTRRYGGNRAALHCCSSCARWPLIGIGLPLQWSLLTRL
jgi:hypothetical protein